MEPPPEEKPSFLSQMKYYTTLTMGTTACVSSFVFMFLIPWVLDPSISTLMANFDPVAVVCKTIQFYHRYGNINCTWSSCKHGCTRELYECDQIYVSYMKVAWDDFEGKELDYDNDTLWVGRGLPLLINIKACGYPPHTNCTVFLANYSSLDTVFPCYYSRVDPDLVIANYSWGDEVQSIVLALLIPNLLCAISLTVVSYWWYPGCQKRRCQYQLPPDQEDASSNTGNEDDEDDDEDEDGEERKDADKNDNETLRKKSKASLEDEKELDTTISISEEKV